MPSAVRPLLASGCAQAYARGMKKAALVLLALLLVVPAAGAKTKKTTISGAFATGGQTMKGWRVLAVASSGRAVSARVQNRRFSLKVRKADLKGMSLQLVDGDGAYAGPVLLRRVKRVGATRFSAKAKTALGRIDLEDGYAAVHRMLGKAAVLAAGSAKVRLTKKGAPVGAGLLGLTAKPKAKRAARAGDPGKGGGSLGGTCTANSPESLGGGDCDADGVPNFADVDDNGNLSLDSVDTSTADTSARINITFGSLVPFPLQLNAYAASTTRDDVNSWLGASGPGNGMSMGYYLQERVIDPVGKFPFQDVWLTCTAAQPWCYGADATATVGGMSPNPAIWPGKHKWDTMPWWDFTGSTCPEDNTGSDSTPACVPISGGQPNSLIGMDRAGDPKGGADRVWIAAVQPNSDDTLGMVRPKDVLTLNAQEHDGTIYSQPATITPYFVTSPGLEGFDVDGTTTTIAYPIDGTTPGASFNANPIQLGADGLLTLRIWRPQRLALPGEADGFYDVHGLHWGVMVGSYYDSHGDFQNLPTLGDPCIPTAIHGADLLPSPDVKQQMLDHTVADVATDPAHATDAESYIEFTVDVAHCMDIAGVPGDAQGTRVEVRAMGATFSGGQQDMTGITVDVKKHA